MAAIQVPTAYRQLVKLVAHAFYGGDCPPKEYLAAADPAKAAASAAPKTAAAPPKPGRQQPGTAGLGIVLLTALTERQWVKEDDLATDLHLHAKMVRKAMRYLEEEQVVRREHRKETLRSKRKEEAALQKAGLNKDLTLVGGSRAGGEAQQAEDDEEEGPHKVDTITYCAIDYPRVVDMLTYRLAVMAQKAKKVAKGGDDIQQYRCTRHDCGKQYTSMQVLELIPPGGGSTGPRGGVELQCSVCTAPVELLDDGTEANRKARVASMRQTHQKLERALKPIQDAIDAVKSLPAPDFDTYAQWLTHQVVLQQGIQQGPAAGSSGGRSQYDRGAAINLDHLQLVVDVGPASGSSTAAAGRGPGGGAAVNGGTAAGRSGAPGGEEGRPPPTGLASGAGPSSSSPAAGGSIKAPPPWLKPGTLGSGPAAAAAAAAAAGGSGAPLTQAQRQAAFLQQLAGGKSPAAAGAPATKPVPPWLKSSVIGGGGGPQVPRPALLGALGLGADLAAGLGGLIGLAAGLKSEGRPDMKRQLEAAEQQQQGEEQEPDRKRLKPDPDCIKSEPQQDSIAAAAAAGIRRHEEVQPAPAFDVMDDTEWEDVHEQPPAADAAAEPGPVSHPIDAEDELEWVDF